MELHLLRLKINKKNQTINLQLHLWIDHLQQIVTQLDLMGEKKALLYGKPLKESKQQGFFFSERTNPPIAGTHTNIKS